MGLFFDEDTQQIYIADPSGNNRVQVMSLQGGFVTRFGKHVLLEPWGISVNKDHIFVTDRVQNSLFKFCKNTLKLLDSTECSQVVQLNEPSGLCIDTNGDVYVANCSNQGIVIFSTNLQFKSSLTHELFCPRDVKLTPDCVVVLDWSPKCVHLFSVDGDYDSLSLRENKTVVCFPSVHLVRILSGNYSIVSDHQLYRVIHHNQEM